MKKTFKTYVINLEHDTIRRSYMDDLLLNLDFPKHIFVPAVYGKMLEQEELSNVFDEKMAYNRYGRYLNRGEIGCTLSHYKCYERIVEEDDYALILEDDISIINDIEIIYQLETYLKTETPIVLFLSGDYWFYKHKKINECYKIASVYDAVGTYAYFINKAAAKLILEKNKIVSCAADNWSLYRQQGVKLRAIYPYLIDANIESFESTINQAYFGECRKNMSMNMKIISYWNALVKKIILHCGGFVSKIRQ